MDIDPILHVVFYKIGPRHLDRLFLSIQPQNVRHAQLDRGNGQDPRAAADIDHGVRSGVPLVEDLFHQNDAQLCAGMGARPERHPGGHEKRLPFLIRCGHPGGDHDKAGADGDRPVIFLPGRTPILHFQGPEGGFRQILNLAQMPQGPFDLLLTLWEPGIPRNVTVHFHHPRQTRYACHRPLPYLLDNNAL